MTISTTLSVVAVAEPWRTNRLYLYGTDTVVAPRDELIPRALVRVGVGTSLHRGLPPGDSAEIALDPALIERIRFSKAMPLIYLWTFEDAALVMPVGVTGRYHVEAFRGPDAWPRAEARAHALSLERGQAVTYRSPRTGRMRV